MGRHGRNIANDAIAGIGQLNNEGRIALMARRFWIGQGHDHGDIRRRRR